MKDVFRADEAVAVIVLVLVGLASVIILRSCM